MKVRIESTADRQFGTNSYLVQDEDTKDAVIIDANLEPQLMVDLARKRNANVKAILLTHTDVDHVGGLNALLDAFGSVPVAVHETERHVVTEGRPLRREFGASTHPVENVVNLVEGEAFHAGSLEFEVLHTPGHSPGGVSLKIGDNLFTGMTLPGKGALGVKSGSLIGVLRLEKSPCCWAAVGTRLLFVTELRPRVPS